MDDHKESAMIALLPTTTEWCHIELPHMTLVYAGETKDLNPTAFNELAKDAASIAMVTEPILLKTNGIEIFGNWSDKSEDKVDVIRLEPTPALWAMRRFVEQWNKSEHPFNPHVTIGPTGIYNDIIPTHLAFDRILVGWGNDYMTFWLKK